MRINGDTLYQERILFMLDNTSSYRRQSETTEGVNLARSTGNNASEGIHLHRSSKRFRENPLETPGPNPGTRHNLSSKQTLNKME